ncbi:hypothetical protein AwDysgo_14930 [Bacteroidales bacterium]|nr:hypothetical protein AwDysgo_14930 [Bacteroidales bacterium]
MKKIYLLALTSLLAFNSFAQIDRSHKPEAGPAPTIHFETPQTFELKNGIKVMLVQDHKLPKISASFSMTRAPKLYGKKKGVGDLLSSILNEGTTKLSKADFDESIDLLGARVSVNAGGGYASSLTADFDQALALMVEAMKYPAFRQEDFEKIKMQQITAMKSDERNTSSIARKVLSHINFGDKHPFGEFSTVEGIEKISLEDVKNEYHKRFMPNNSYLVFIGDINLDQAKKYAEKYFDSWEKGKLSETPVIKVKPATKTQVFVVDVPTASQAMMLVSNIVENTRLNPESYGLSVANQILGSNDGYLFMNLREKHSYTYGAYSSVGTDKYGATFTAEANVGHAVIDSAIIETFKEMNRLSNEPAAADAIQLIKNKENGKFALAMENKGNIASYAINIERDNLPKDYYTTFLQKINEVGASEIQAVAKKYINTNAMNIVVAGNAALIADKMEGLGYHVTYLDAFGKKIDRPTLSNEE